MAATVKSLFSEMLKTLPSERLINYHDLSPFNKDMAKELSEAKASKDPKAILEVINKFLVSF